jgi:hypothetical protein
MTNYVPGPRLPLPTGQAGIQGVGGYGVVGYPISYI